MTSPAKRFVSGIVCEWRRRLHPCSWILFAGSFLECQQHFILGSLITRQNSGGSRRDRSFDAVTLFLCRLLTFHYITLQNSSVSPVKCVLLTEPHTRQSISSFWCRLSHTLPVSCKEISRTLPRVYGFYQPTMLTSNRYRLVYLSRDNSFS